MRPSLVKYSREFQAQVAGVPTTPTGYHQWHRSLVAELGRFGSRDPVGYEAGISLLEYVGDRATMATDPWGLQIIVDIIDHHIDQDIDRPRDRPPIPREHRPIDPGCDERLERCVAAAEDNLRNCVWRGRGLRTILCFRTCPEKAAGGACMLSCLGFYEKVCYADKDRVINKCHDAHRLCKDNGKWPEGVGFWGWDWGNCDDCW